MRTLRTLMVGLALLTAAGSGWAVEDVLGLPVDVTVEKYVDITFTTPTIAVTAADWNNVAPTAGTQSGTIDANCAFTTVLSATPMILNKHTTGTSSQVAGLATAVGNPFFWDSQLTLNSKSVSLGAIVSAPLFTNTDTTMTIAATPAGSYPVVVGVKVKANIPSATGGTIMGATAPVTGGATVTLTVTAD